MSVLDVQSLGAVLSLGTASDTAFADDHPLVIAEMAHAGWESITRADYIQPIVDQADYTYPASAIVVTHLRYGESPMSPARWAHFHAVADGLWEERAGTPLVWTTDGVSERTFRVHPKPDRTGPSLGGNTPYTAMRSRTFVVISLASGDEPAYETLWVALDCLARQMERDASQGDAAYAEACRLIARAMRELLLAVHTTAV